MPNAAASSSSAKVIFSARNVSGATQVGEEDVAGQSSDLWSDILNGANRGSRGNWGRKNVLLLSERHHGRRHLLSQLTAISQLKRRNTKRSDSTTKSGPSLAMGYEVLEVREEGDEDSIPPVSIFYPPSSHPSMLRLIPNSLPPKSFTDSAVMILLDWTKPSTMTRELLTWLRWVDEWASSAGERARGDADLLHDRLQSHIQHYTEPPTTSTGSAAPLTTYSGGPLLPLGQGTLTLNKAGVPIIVVCTKADLMDSTGDELGMKGQWEERTDWVQQVLRTICLAYGAALFYTAPTSPSTYSLLRSYILHRLYTIPPPLEKGNSNSEAPSLQQVRFPFVHRANVLDRDAVMVPAGWDSWGKINVLRERFDPARVCQAWEISLSRTEGDEESERGIEDLWDEIIPDTSKPKVTTGNSIATTSEPEQSFLSRQLDILVKDPNRDPRASFRQAAAAVSASASAAAQSSSTAGPAGIGSVGGTGGTDAGVVGPLGSGGLNLPGVEKAMNDMEGGASVEDMKEKFARLGRRDTTRPGPLSPTGGTGSSDARTPAVPNEALHNFFQGLLATKGKSSGSSATKTPTPPTSAKSTTKSEDT